MSTHHHTPNVHNRLATKKDRRAQSSAFADLVRWCRAHRAEHIDDCGEVDVTGLAIACAEAHGCDDPGEHHPCWDAATV
jgi:hypothetical protein